MKGILLSSFILLTVFLSLAAASAASFSLDKSSITLTQPLNSTTFKITSSSLLNVSITTPIINSVSFSIPESQININGTRTFTLVPSSSTLDSSFKLGNTYTDNIIINNTNNPSDGTIIPVKILKDFCSNGEQGNLTITGVDITNNGEGSETEWHPLDEIELKVTVQNNNQESSNRVSTRVKVALYDSSGSEKLSLDTINFGNIAGDGGDKEQTITFTVPASLDATDYFLYVKAYKSSGENSVCTGVSSAFDQQYFDTISVVREDTSDKQVVFDKIVLDPTTALCGQDVALNANVVNIGTSDQQKVKAEIINNELGINSFQIYNNLNQGDSQDFTYTLTVPANATEKTYRIILRNLYDFNDNFPEDDNNAYDTTSVDFPINLVVKGNCVTPTTNNAAISAVLQTPDSQVTAGNEVIIKATVTNTGTAATTYALSLTGFEGFSTLESVTPATMTLNAGQSQDATIKLKLNSDALGEQVFNINAAFGSQTKTQQISLSVASGSGSAILDSLKNNWFIWLIVAINVILIVAIIIVIVRMAKA